MDLSLAWIDFQKALDNVPHSWVEKSIEMVGVKNEIVNCQCINGEMEHKVAFKNKTGSNAIAIHSNTKRNIPGGFLWPLLFCAAHIT